MRKILLVFLIVASGNAICQDNKLIPFISLGLDYRQYPIDIEDVPLGGYHSNGNFYGMEFWQVYSAQTRYGLMLRKDWSVSLAGYVRYNHFHWLEGDDLRQINPQNPTVAPPQNKKEKKNFKYDLFLDLEKKFRINKIKPRYLTCLIGLGYVNLNTRYDFSYSFIYPNGQLSPPDYYKGDLKHFTPRISVGYQHKKIKATVDAYLIEGPDLTNLASLWLGSTLSFEIRLKK